MRPFWGWILLGLAVILTAAVLAGMWINRNPGAAARGADVLRGIFGDEAVARLETAVYGAQDALQRLRYRVSGSQPDAPWQVPTSQAAAVLPNPTQPLPSATAVPTTTAGTSPSTPALARTAAPSPTPTLPATPPWTLTPLQKTGHIPGEGEWTPFLTSAQGTTLASRTFVQPDPDRPFVVAAVVAFNLDQTRLHFVPGTEEPISDVKIARPGKIDPADLQPGVLLSVFNGGFKTRHGHFGAMFNGTILVPPKPDLGTVAIYPDGQVALGQWGSEIDPTLPMTAWRQNGPLVVHHGEINPLVSDPRPDIWGYTINETVPIWRSGIGISADRRTFYYFAGPGLTLPALAQAMKLAGAANAIQLDINNYWVHFDAITFPNGKPKTNPLFSDMGADNPNRYLYTYTRDFFYVTADYPAN